jgi:hypothetical protein
MTEPVAELLDLYDHSAILEQAWTIPAPWNLTKRFSLVFSCSGSFNRLAWSIFRPPNSLRQQAMQAGRIHAGELTTSQDEHRADQRNSR